MKYVSYVAITFRVHAGAVSIGHDKGFGLWTIRSTRRRYRQERSRLDLVDTIGVLVTDQPEPLPAPAGPREEPARRPNTNRTASHGFAGGATRLECPCRNPIRRIVKDRVTASSL
jgi:hypothetical protein